MRTNPTALLDTKRRTQTNPLETIYATRNKNYISISLGKITRISKEINQRKNKTPKKNEIGEDPRPKELTATLQPTLVLEGHREDDLGWQWSTATRDPPPRFRKLPCELGSIPRRKSRKLKPIRRPIIAEKGRKIAPFSSSSTTLLGCPSRLRLSCGVDDKDKPTTFYFMSFYFFR